MEIEIQATATTQGGKEYKLYMKDGDWGYRWWGDGKLPSMISGLFTNIVDAQVAMKNYLNMKVEEANTPSRLEELKGCRTNDDLKAFCEKHNLNTPDGTNTNSRKKAIKEKLLAQGDKE